jgi:hypothetical protein
MSNECGSRQEDPERTLRKENSRINLYRNHFSGAVTIFLVGSRVLWVAVL